MENIEDFIAAHQYDLTAIVALRQKDNPKRSYFYGLPVYYVNRIRKAKSRGIGFSLTIEEHDRLLNLPCKYCGTYENIGIDRVDSSDSYNYNNCVPCCFKCNIMKARLVR